MDEEPVLVVFLGALIEMSFVTIEVGDSEDTEP